MVDKNYSLFPLDWISPCARGECSLDRDKRMFFSSIEYLKSYHILCFFLACAMGFLYSYFILSETSNEFFFLGSWLYFLALSILSLLICFMLSLFARILISQANSVPAIYSLDSSTAVILRFLIVTALLGWLYCLWIPCLLSWFIASSSNFLRVDSWGLSEYKIQIWKLHPFTIFKILHFSFSASNNWFQNDEWFRSVFLCRFFSHGRY